MGLTYRRNRFDLYQWCGRFSPETHCKPIHPCIPSVSIHITVRFASLFEQAISNSAMVSSEVNYWLAALVDETVMLKVEFNADCLRLIDMAATGLEM